MPDDVSISTPTYNWSTVKSDVTTSSWQRCVCGTVYSWWVSMCRNSHPIVKVRSDEAD